MTGSVPLRRLLWAASAGVVAVWAALLMLWSPAPFTLTFDDAYYYLGIARNLVDGYGSSFDRLNPTNGYHPLWMLVSLAPFAAGLDDDGAVRALLLVQLVVCWGGTLALVSALIGDTVDDAVAGDRPHPAVVRAAVIAVFVLIAANPFVVKVFVNGLESGLVGLVHAALLLSVTRRGGRVVEGTTTRQRIALAGLLALAFLSRTDAVLLVAPLGLWSLAELWRGSAGWWQRVRPLVEVFGPVAVVAGLYLVSNRVWFGTTVQVSGLIKRVPLTLPRAAVMAVLVGLGFAVARHGFRRLHGAKARRQPRLVRTGRFALATSWYAAFCLVLLGYYTVLQSQQWLWYFAPVVLYGSVSAVLVTADLALGALDEAPADRRPAAAVGPVAAIVCVPLVLAFGLQVRTFTDPALRSIQEANRDAGIAIDRTLPPDAVLASWDAGVVGFFSHRRVVNLDGVVNSVEFYRAAREGRLATFLDDDGVTWIVNHGTPVDGQDEDIVRFVRDNWGDDVASRTTLERTWPFRYSGTTTGSGGLQGGGPRELAVFLYRLPPVDRR